MKVVCVDVNFELFCIALVNVAETLGAPIKLYVWLSTLIKPAQPRV